MKLSKFISEIKKVAVIPFSTSTTDEEEAFFQTGMTQELIDELSKVDRLKVISQKSTKVLTSGFDQTSSLILNVIKGIDYFVEGSFERETDGIHVQIILRESINGELVWQKQYAKGLSEIRKDPRFIQLMRDLNLPDPAPLEYYPES